MATEEPDSQPGKTTLSLFAGILGGALITLTLVGIAVWFTTGIGLLRLMGVVKDGHAWINVDQPTVVRQIQKLQRLETVSYTMDKIISGGHDNPLLPKFLVSDRLLLVVHGEVIAGVDLGKLRASDVAVNNRRIFVRLPKAEILVTRLDNEKTRVYSRDTGLFSSPDPNLETQVRQEAERQLQQAALLDGILKSADENARNSVQSILNGLGFEQITFP
ncbi:MAG TPA: DUF4230 domain-containing protein [Verrucomicrobiae bacterium]|nr:DUF4230 domain-containing protein [Verrucomicrobiae bacterium]